MGDVIAGFRNYSKLYRGASLWVLAISSNFSSISPVAFNGVATSVYLFCIYH